MALVVGRTAAGLFVRGAESEKSIISVDRRLEGERGSCGEVNRAELERSEGSTCGLGHREHSSSHDTWEIVVSQSTVAQQPFHFIFTGYLQGFVVDATGIVEDEWGTAVRWRPGTEKQTVGDS